MEQLSRNEKIAHMRKNNKSYKVHKSPKTKNHPVHSSHKTPPNEKTNVSQFGIQEKSKETSSFQFRIAIASFLFLAFLGMKEHNFVYHNISYETVMEILSSNSGMEAAEEKIISAFHRLD